MLLQAAPSTPLPMALATLNLLHSWLLMALEHQRCPQNSMLPVTTKLLHGWLLMALQHQHCPRHNLLLCSQHPVV